MDINTGARKSKLKQFEFTDNSDIKTFLGVSIDKMGLTAMYISQPHLIARIFNTARLEPDEGSARNTKDTLVTKLLLIKDTNGEPRTLLWNYQSVIGMLNYLSNFT